MPVIRKEKADAAFRSAVVLDLGDLRRQADAIKQEARRQAESIINRAAERAKHLTDGAAEKGYREGYEKGLREGLQSGKEEGLKLAQQQAESEINDLLQRWEKTLTDFENQRAGLLRQAREDVLRLALAVAEKVVHAAVELTPEAALQQAEKAIALISEPSELRLRVNPADLQIFREHLPELEKRLRGSEALELQADDDVSPGGCVVAHGKGIIDARIETQLERIISDLLPEGDKSSQVRDETENADPGRGET